MFKKLVLVEFLASALDQSPGPSPGYSSRGGKNQKEGPKIRKAGHILKIPYWIMQQPGGQT